VPRSYALCHLLGQVPSGGTGTAGAPVWTEWVRNLSPAVTGVAVLVGALWALFRFRRGRVFRPRCCTDIDVTGINHPRKYLLKVDIRIENTGDTCVVFRSSDRALLEVIPYGEHDKRGRTVWCDSAKLSDDIFTHNNRKGVELEHIIRRKGGRKKRKEVGRYLEPGEHLTRSVVFELPDSWYCCKIRLSMESRKRRVLREDKPLIWVGERAVFRDVVTHRERAVR
jgi:hypothetical protein